MTDRASPAEIGAAADDRELARAEVLERIKIQASIADAALKSVILVNGGAIIALFTFIGNVGTKGVIRVETGALWTAFAIFIGGLVSALVAHLFAFLSQERFYRGSMMEIWRAQRVIHDGERPTGHTEDELREHGNGQACLMIGVVLAMLSIACFTVGSWFALSGVLAG